MLLSFVPKQGAYGFFRYVRESQVSNIRISMFSAELETTITTILGRWHNTLGVMGPTISIINRYAWYFMIHRIT